MIYNMFLCDEFIYLIPTNLVGIEKKILYYNNYL